MQTKVIRFISIFGLLLMLMASIILMPSISYAETATYVKASQLDDEIINNEYAYKSDVAIMHASDTFYIPVSYYYLNPTLAFGNAYAVSYCGLTTGLYVTLENPSTNELDLEEGVDYSPNVIVTLKNDTALINTASIDSTYEIRFLGYNEDSTKYFCLATNNDNNLFGFISKDDLNDFNVPYQKATQEKRDALILARQQQEYQEKGYLQLNSSYALRIIIIVAIAVPIVLFTLLIFKRNKNSKEPNQLSRENEIDNTKKDN